jgi:ATP-dependent RNA helicase RhlE
MPGSKGPSSRPNNRQGGSSSRPAGNSYGSRPASAGSYSSRPSSGGYGSRPASGGYSSRPSGNRFGSRPQSGGYGNRPSGNRGNFGGNRSRGKNMGQYIDSARFINKAVITEKVEHFVPEHMFTDFKVDEFLKKNIEAKGYKAPTPIQDRTIPHILQGRDVVGIANTGTGKTAAFLVPLIDKVLKNSRENVLIVVPTRELAQQIHEEFLGFAKNMKIRAVTCVGGMSIGKQISDLKYRTNFVIGTPGRLKDLIDRKFIPLAAFNTVVLDEADRMLDMGFINDIKYMLAMMPKVRHTLFFSATMSPEIQSLIKVFLNEPVSISVKTQDTAKNVDQDVIRLERGADKIEVLHKLLSEQEFNKVLIFGRTKHGVEKLSKVLSQKGITAESIHGNKSQVQRQRALDAFKLNKVQVLVATDVAARGLDIADVSHVINFDVPATYDDYVHRIGRTGRGGKKGKALTFVE